MTRRLSVFLFLILVAISWGVASGQELSVKELLGKGIFFDEDCP